MVLGFLFGFWQIEGGSVGLFLIIFVKNQFFKVSLELKLHSNWNIQLRKHQNIQLPILRLLISAQNHVGSSWKQMSTAVFILFKGTPTCKETELMLLLWA